MDSDYRSKLEQFFGLVPKSAKPTLINRVLGAEYYGEVPSGTPIIPIKSRAELPAARAAIAKATIV